MAITRKENLMKRQQYRCSCGNSIVVENYFPEERSLPALGCGRCKKGQGLSMNDQVMQRVGLLAVGESALYSL